MSKTPLPTINKYGLLGNARQIPSPNQEERPNDEISLIVLHNISLPPFQYGSDAVNNLFTNQVKEQDDPFFSVIKDFRVSSHLFINREGHITQYVPFLKMAYHAGISNFQGRNACNHFSIGIELEGCDFEPFSEAQYQSLIPVLKSLTTHYPIQAITGHQHIAPQRKTDPGHFFDWKRLEHEFSPQKDLIHYRI